MDLFSAFLTEFSTYLSLFLYYQKTQIPWISPGEFLLIVQ